MNIKVSKKEVFLEVERRSSLEGYILSERYDSLWANETKGELLESYWIEGCNAVVQMMREFIDDSTAEADLSKYNQEEEFSISLKMPGRYNTNLEGSIATGIKMMIACNILNRWFSVCAQELAPKYDTESKSYFEDVRIKLYYRISPERTMVAASNDDDGAVKNEVSLSLSEDTEPVSRTENMSYVSTDDTESLLVDEKADYNRQTDNVPLEQRKIC